VNDTSVFPEILAPAGTPEALEAALQSGADAVYFGLKQFNARRGARNFLPAELAATVRRIHDAGARACLTLNIDLAQRELGEAARHLELARQAKVDAVLVRDPALLALRPFFPELEFHFSTQAGISSSAGMAAARELGVGRVVLARELSLDEIRAAAAVPGVGTEVFVQGALCFSVSGRCLLSSWVGGRSGNRGTCTSPCRVAWQIDGQAAGRPLSMHDLCLLERLQELHAAGVRALKIEGRLKTPEWVSRAVTLYRRALDAWKPAPAAADTGRSSPASRADLLAEAARLGAYTGRRLTTGYADGLRTDLTGESGRPAAQTGAALLNPEPSPAATIRIVADGKGGLLWQFLYGGQTFERRTPHQPVRNVERSLTLAEAVTRLTAAMPDDTTVGVTELADPDLRIPRSTANHVARDVAAFLNRLQKEPDGTVRIELSVPVKAALAAASPHLANSRSLGQDRPDRVRLEPTAVEALLPRLGETGVILDNAAAQDIDCWAARLGGDRLIVALPSVFYEADIPAVISLLDACRTAGLCAEVNSWDGWQLARRCGVRLEAGPGLMVLNALAARKLGELGCAGVAISLEADRRQLEELCAAAAVPLSLTVFGRPPLMRTRVEFRAAAVLGRLFEDSRGVQMRPRLEGCLTVFRPAEPFALCDLRNPAIRAAHLVVDLLASPDPAAEWLAVLDGSCRPRLRFNYERTLR